MSSIARAVLVFALLAEASCGGRAQGSTAAQDAQGVTVFEGARLIGQGEPALVQRAGEMFGGVGKGGGAGAEGSRRERGAARGGGGA